MISDKRIAIFGLGKEGASSANFLGAQNEITIFDDKQKSQIDETFINSLKVKAELRLGQKPKEGEKFDYVLRSPGVQINNPSYRSLIKAGAIPTSQTKLFFDFFPGKIIAVTGTKGKGTTATLIYQFLKTQTPNVFLAGNIGTPALEILKDADKDSVAVLELSSFQLIDLTKSPKIAVVLMTTSEHLDWHKDSEEYIDAKKAIVKFQKEDDFAVINADFPSSRSFSQKTKAKVYFFSTQNEENGAFIKNGKLISKIKAEEEIIKTEEVLLPGPHNLQNVLAAISVAKIENIENKNIVKVLKSFKGLPHRLELVKEEGGVKFYNDSFSTTPETTIAAVKAFTNPKILILGGSSKKSDFTGLAKEIINPKNNVKSLILIGDEAKRIKETLVKEGSFSGQIVEGLENMHDIVQKSKELSQSGDIVLLSPACASFGLFKNYRQRGDLFTKEVNLL